MTGRGQNRSRPGRRGVALAAAIAALLVCAWMAAAAGAATIVVDGDDAGSDLDGCGVVLGADAGTGDACNTIQAGVDAATEGDTVQVEPSAAPYAEAITISKADLRLAGPREGVPGTRREHVPDLATEAVIDAPDTATAAITVTAAGVKIDGLFFSGKAALDGDSFPAVSLLAGAGEVLDNVIVDHVPGVRLTGTDQLVARNSFVQELSQARFHGVIGDSPVSDVAVLENRFDEDGVPIAFADDFAKTGIAIEDNSLLATPGGLAMDLVGLAASTVRGNTVSGGGDGIRVLVGERAAARRQHDRRSRAVRHCAPPASDAAGEQGRRDRAQSAARQRQPGEPGQRRDQRRHGQP